MVNAAKQEGTEAAPQRRTFMKEIVREVKELEMVPKLLELREAVKHVNDKEAQAKQKRAAINEELKEARGVRDELLKVTESGVERVTVEVYTKVNGQQLETYLAATDELLPMCTRALTAAEQQLTFDEMVNLPPGDDPRVEAMEKEQQDKDEDDEDDEETLEE